MEIRPDKGPFYAYAYITYPHYNKALHMYLNSCMCMHCTVSRCTHCVHGLATLLTTGTYPDASDKVSQVRILIYYFLRPSLILYSHLRPGPLSSVFRIGFAAKMLHVCSFVIFSCVLHVPSITSSNFEEVAGSPTATAVHLERQK